MALSLNNNKMKAGLSMSHIQLQHIKPPLSAFVDPLFSYLHTTLHILILPYFFKVETNQMESDHDHQAAISENPSDGEDQGASHVTPRSYECNFCRRGFSNAQALGGHMNIHRKDKAKLKQQQSSNQTQVQPSLDKGVPPQDQTKSGEEPPKWNWNVSSEEHVSSGATHTRQLPLFEESPTSSETLKPPQGQNTTEGALISTRDSSLELDLELRPGIEPQDSSAETGTRNFF